MLLLRSNAIHFRSHLLFFVLLVDHLVEEPAANTPVFAHLARIIRKQKLPEFHVLAFGCHVKRGVPLIVWRVNVCCEVQQKLRGLYAAYFRCAVKRGSAVLVALNFTAKPML